MRLKTISEPLFLCCFYAPGSHHPLLVRRKFYDFFSRKFADFAALGKVYLIGDTNARLGIVLEDRNLRGQLTSNANKPLFLEFLEYSGLVILNSVYSRGKPTYEVVGRKRSIIDLCLTNSPETVVDFKTEPTSLGVSSQTCHKVLTVKISLDSFKRDTISLPRRTVFGRLSFVKQNKILGEVTNQIIENQRVGLSPDYFLLVEMFCSAKRKILGVLLWFVAPLVLGRTSVG